ncbi:hypothetical protein [Streptomyces bluensis]|uniref:hypothetical protein n=1 Tax=Streptomyces bluensis TaxID=33897 RepID=UPI00332B89B9
MTRATAAGSSAGGMAARGKRSARAGQAGPGSVSVPPSRNRRRTSADGGSARGTAFTPFRPVAFMTVRGESPASTTGRPGRASRVRPASRQPSASASCGTITGTSAGTRWMSLTTITPQRSGIPRLVRRSAV